MFNLSGMLTNAGRRTRSWHATAFSRRKAYRHADLDIPTLGWMLRLAQEATGLQLRVSAQLVNSVHAVYGVLAAVIHKLRTGEGQYVEVPMFESMVSFNTVEHLCDNSYVPPTVGPSAIGPGESNGYYERQIDPTRQPMRTKDGWIAFAPYLDDRWVRFFEAAGYGHVLKEPRFIDKPTRRANMSQMFEVMAKIAPERTTDEWLALMKTGLITIPGRCGQSYTGLTTVTKKQRLDSVRTRVSIQFLARNLSVTTRDHC